MLEYLLIAKTSCKALKYYQIADITFLAIICTIKVKVITRIPAVVAAIATELKIYSILADGYYFGNGYDAFAYVELGNRSPICLKARTYLYQQILLVEYLSDLQRFRMNFQISVEFQVKLL